MAEHTVRRQRNLLLVKLNSCHPAAPIIHIPLQSGNKRHRVSFILSRFLHTTSRGTLGAVPGLRDSVRPQVRRLCQRLTSAWITPTDGAAERWMLSCFARQPRVLSYMLGPIALCVCTLCASKQIINDLFSPSGKKKKQSIIKSFLLDLQLMSFETDCSILSVIKPLQNAAAWIINK